ncbi:MAG: hypothetical protein ACYDHW_12435 [Syntrophorhabdaceae bacterium]
MSDIIAVCPRCGAKNRVPLNRRQEPFKCGKCKEHLDLEAIYPGKAVDVTESTFQGEVVDFKGPVLVEFFAPW